MQDMYMELCKLNMSGAKDMYLVRQQKTGLLAVKKVVDEQLFPLYKRLLEIRHVNLMKILDVFMDENRCVVISEYIIGETLSDILRNPGRFSEEFVEKYMVMLCKAVQSLHNYGIIHRDISPNNVMITSDGIIKLCDFDISQLRNYETNQPPRGTYGYAPPEQFGYGMTDEQSDIYAIGKLGYTMLSGYYNHFVCKTGRLRRVIYRAMSMDKKSRYSSITKLLEELTMITEKKQGKFSSFLCCIPGFRTMTSWKIITAVIAYPLLMFIDFEIFHNCFENGLSVIFYIILPWILYMDLFRVSKHIFKLEPGQSWFRIIIGFALQMIGYYFG